MVIVRVLAMFVALGFGPASAQGHHTRADAVALVDRAADHLRTVGRQAAFAAFDDRHGAFVDGDLYLFVLDAEDGNLTMLAHGTNPALIGLAQRPVVDAEGRAFNDETAALVRNKGSGWISYMWPNPVTKRIASKTSYVRGVDDVIIGAGIYP